MLIEKKILNNASMSVLQTIVSAFILFVVYRYLLIHLGSEKLGLWSVLMATTSVARLSDLGLTGSVVKYVAKYRAIKSVEGAGEVVQTATLSIGLIMMFICLLVYPLLIAVLPFFLPAGFVPQAIAILPWALASLFFSAIGGVFLSGLDGCQRMDIRNILMVFANIFFLAFVILLLPIFGLVGVAIGQVIQAALVAIVGWVLLRKQLPELPFLPSIWSRTKFKEMFSYSVNFQINALAIMLFEPLTKVLMSRYGGLSSAGYYEMASQFVLKMRSLIMVATQAVVPTVAELVESAPLEVKGLYRKAYKLVFLTMPLYVGIGISLPLISYFWLGSIENVFINFGFLLVLGWGVNTLASPAYYFNLGSGDLTWNTVSHVLMALLNIAFGLSIGKSFGSAGIVAGAMGALIIGSIVLIYKFNTKHNISISALLPTEHRRLFIFIFIFVLLLFLVHYFQLFGTKNRQLYFFILCFYISMVSLLLWKHSYRKKYFKNFFKTGLRI